ncbi:MAG: NUDIX domain-containing protein [Nanoarchaeota archaeon]|nr:NUDIX domain-containing protein [Nanoarchaeota archaeon]MBU1028063.1 NUDIX domain-containing protein [Nanoarchaeota archaeon]
MENIVLAAIILNSNNEFLLQKKDLGHPWIPGKWCFFGGALKENKEPQQTLKEILKRKLGINIEIIKFYKNYNFEIKYDNIVKKGQDQIYICRFNEKTSEIKLSEGAGFAFFNKKEIETIPLTKHGLEILKEYFGKEK